MVCAFCGKEMPTYADFCPYCGQAVDQGAGARPPEFWEYCEIEVASSHGPDVAIGWFEANAVGRTGEFEAGRSTGNVYFLGIEPEGDAAADCQELVQDLLRQGWQPLSGPKQFKRKAAPPG